jgi:archaellum component FlaC
MNKSSSSFSSTPLTLSECNEPKDEINSFKEIHNDLNEIKDELDDIHEAIDEIHESLEEVERLNFFKRNKKIIGSILSTVGLAFMWALSNLCAR